MPIRPPLNFHPSQGTSTINAGVALKNQPALAKKLGLKVVARPTQKPAHVRLAFVFLRLLTMALASPSEPSQLLPDPKKLSSAPNI
jgi:hypothetical protein